MARLSAAEFFAGIGLVRRALEAGGVDVVYANDIDRLKARMYEANFGERDFHLGDIADVRPRDIPDVDIATASFPCTDLSLAGNRAGLDGPESGAFWHFADILDGLGRRRPQAILLENVAGLGTSRGGKDLTAALRTLNALGYACDIVQLNAVRWVPQSRPRVFVVGTLGDLADPGDWGPDELRPEWISRFVESHPALHLEPARLELPPPVEGRLSDLVERLDMDDERWWEASRFGRFVESLSQTQLDRLLAMRDGRKVTWRTAYRRTRFGRPVWEIRADEISGCLRTARGGSSKQAVVEAGRGYMNARWMTANEYAALMGARGHVTVSEGVSENQAIFGLGDAVCVPAVIWLVREYLVPLARGRLTGAKKVAVAV
ncbi:MAG TPA: DNA (cytosine-5-)-methyltransferase [Chloroflexi bacterium]|nr:DNA (cytosine-5-)-methyltransferase [Chloroflexota bacterium]